MLIPRMKTAALLAVIVAVPVALPGCVTPFERQTAQNLRDALLSAHQAEVERMGGARALPLEREPSAFRDSLNRVVERQREEGQLGPDEGGADEQIAHADEVSGAAAYVDDTPDFGPDLAGRDEPELVSVDLQSALQRAMANNLDAKIARLNPIIAEHQVTQAQSDFDTVVFSNVAWQKNDTPQPAGSIPGISGNAQSETLQFQTGIRQTFETGTQLTVQAQTQRNEQSPSVFGTSRYYDADVLVQITQPLMRGFGSDVNRAGIVIAELAEAQQVEQFRSTLLDLASAVEQTYWQLAQARQALLIQQGLLERTVAMRDKLEPRVGFDLLQADLNEVNARVGQRRADVLRAQRNVRDLSDQLKRLINDADLPVVGEQMLVPSDLPVDSPITISRLDEVTTALQHRPEMAVALLQIEDVDVRRLVADNNRLPILNLTASVNYNGLDIDDSLDALGNTADLDFIDYALGVQFERPWGNRDAEAIYAQRSLERVQALDNYRRQAQIVTIEVKRAIRQVQEQYQLIGTTRETRRASALSLEVADVQLDQGGRNEETYTIRVDRVLARQDALAQAELAELQALTDYMNALSELRRATGTSLDHAGIDFESERGRE
ncbi:MAG: TolC family protein [Phycisphaerales bacterium JB063]